MKTSPPLHKIRELDAPGLSQVLGRHVTLLVTSCILLAVTAWSHRLTMLNLYHGWQPDDYSAGQLVPLVAVALVWRQRRTLLERPLAPCWVGGIALLLLAEVIRGYGFLSALASIERYSLVLTATGLVLLVAGWRVLRRLFWVLLFLFLMVPLPGMIHNRISLPLQRIATTGAAFLLEAFGVWVEQQGNVVVLNDDTPLAVAEACSGLRMLTAFVIIAAFVAYVVKRPKWQKAVLFFSSVPLAVLCNLLRIVVTAILMLHVNSDIADKFFHDFAGYVMMPVAVLLLFGELRILEQMVVPDEIPATTKKVGPTKSSKIRHVENT